MDKFFLCLILIGAWECKYNVLGARDQLLMITNHGIHSFNSTSKHSTTFYNSTLVDDVAYDFEIQTIFFVHKSNEIMSKNLITNNERVILKGKMGAIFHLNIDWISKKIYFYHQERQLVEVCSYMGHQRYALITRGVANLKGMAISPQHGYMFLLDGSEVSKIERLDLDGKNRKTIVGGDHVFDPIAVAVDEKNFDVYWLDAEKMTVEVMKMDGSNIRTIHKGNKFLEVDLMAVMERKIYFFNYHELKTFSCSKEADSDLKSCKLVLANEPVFALESYGAYYQPFKNSPCQVDNGGCSNLCLTTPTNYSCACPSGYKLLDKYRCSTEIKEKIFIATKENLQIVAMDIENKVALELPIKEVNSPISVDFDPVDNMLYWTGNSENNFGIIKRASIDGTVSETVIPAGFTMPDHLAIDWVSRHLYWSCPHQAKIFVALLDGSLTRTVIEKDLEKPRGVSVDPSRAKLYFTDWGKRPKIESCDLDGSNRKIIVENGIVWPNDLAIDYVRNHLYWVDGDLQVIEFIDLEKNTRHFVEKSYKTPHMFGIEIFDSVIYWTDIQMRAVFQVDITTRKYKETIGNVASIMGLAVPKNLSASKKNLCSGKTHGCSHFCFYKSDSTVVCKCRDGYVLDGDGKTCQPASGYLLYSTRTFIKALSLDNTSQPTIPSIVGNEITVIESDASSGRVIWVESATNGAGSWSIKSSFLNDSSSTKVVQIGFYEPINGIAVDWVSRNIYWSRTYWGMIEISRIDGSYRSTLIQRESRISLLAINPLEGKLYWLEFDDKVSRLMSSKLNGADVEILRNTSDEAYGLTVDAKSDRIYWSLKHSRSIESVHMNGSGYTVIKKNLGHLVGLVNFKGNLYFCENENPYTEFGGIYSVNKMNGERKAVLASSASQIWFQDLNIMHAKLQSGVNNCTELNGGCDHLCVATSKTQHQCLCETHYELSKDDHRTCLAPSEFILVSGDIAIYRFSLDTSKRETTLHFDSPINIDKIEYNMRTGTVYWLDGKTINYLANGEIQELYLGTHSSPTSFAIDYFTNCLYWTDVKRNTIEFMNLDNPNSRGVVFRHNKYRPTKLIIYPEKGMIFFISEFYPQNEIVIDSIESISFDGTNLRRIHKFSDTSIRSNTRDRYDLTLDRKAERIFWLHLREGIIESSYIYGSGRSQIEMKFNTKQHQPVAIAAHGQYLYWVDFSVDSKFEKLKRRPLENGRKISVFHGVFEKTNNIVIVDLHRGEDYHPCRTNNGGCSHICYVIHDRHGKKSRRCACPIGYDFVSPQDNVCLKNERCTNVCEENCPAVRNVYCTEIKHCQKEFLARTKCSCREGEFRCSNNSCILFRQMCDNKPDCPNGEDENPIKCALFFGNTSFTLPSTRPTSRIYVGPYQESNGDFSKYTAGIVSGLILTVLIILCSLYGICRAHYKKVNKLKEQEKPLQGTTEDVYQMTPIQPVSLASQSDISMNENGRILSLNTINSLGGIHTRYVTGSSNVADSVVMPLNPPPSLCSVSKTSRLLDDDTGTILTLDTIYEPKREVHAPPATPLYSPSESGTLLSAFSRQEKPRVMCSRPQCVSCRNHAKLDYREYKQVQHDEAKHYPSSENSYATTEYSRRKSRHLSCSSEETLFGKSVSRQPSYISDLNKNDDLPLRYAPLPSIASERSLSEHSSHPKDYYDLGCSPYPPQRDFYNTYAPPPSPGTEYSRRSGRNASFKEELNISECLSVNSLTIPAGIRDFNEYHKDYGDNDESDNDIEVKRLLYETSTDDGQHNNFLTTVNRNHTSNNLLVNSDVNKRNTSGGDFSTVI